MIKTRQLVHLIPNDLSRLVTGYTSNARYLVNKAESERKITFTQYYRKMGFDLEAIDLSYYSNSDFPDAEIALFMKKRLV